MIEEQIAKVLNERFKEEDLATCFLIDIKTSASNKLTVFVDADDQLTIEKCRKISRFLEDKIEQNEWLPEHYTLEVSSPGLDKPLKFKRQYAKQVGRTAAIVLSDGQKIEGRIRSVSEQFLTIELDDNDHREISWDDIEETKILVSFKKR